MKIAITSSGDNFESAMDLRFGRCKYFAMYDTETKKYEFIDNIAAQSEQGAGIAAAQNVIKMNTDVLLTGRLGPKALQVIENTGITTKFYDSGSVAEVVYQYMKSI